MNKGKTIFVISHNTEDIEKYRKILKELGLEVITSLDIESSTFNEYDGQEIEYRAALNGISKCDGVTSLENTVLTSKIIKVCSMFNITYLSPDNWIAYLN